jgi:transketolase
MAKQWKTANLREAYGQALIRIGATVQDIVVLEADLGKSTKTCYFKDEYPDRFFEMGIAEQNMASTAAGFALAGKIPFMHSFAVFASGRTYDQLRNSICIPGLGVKICGSSYGLSDFGDGKTHQSVEDAAVMRALPNMTVITPVDAPQTERMIEAVIDYPGPVYMRINRNDQPVLTEDIASFEIGQMQILADGSDAAVIAYGSMVHKAMEARDLLADEGISVRVVNAPTLKPMADDEVMRCIEGVRGVVTAEEHTVIGGLGSAVAECMRRTKGVSLEFIGIKDRFGISAEEYEPLLEYFGLTPVAIADAVKSVLQ